MKTPQRVDRWGVLFWMHATACGKWGSISIAEAERAWLRLLAHEAPGRGDTEAWLALHRARHAIPCRVTPIQVSSLPPNYLFFIGFLRDSWALSGVLHGIIDRHSQPAVITTPHTMAQTLYDKLWNTHVVHTEEDGTTILYIDRHLLHEVTSPQAFEWLKIAERPVWRISANLAVSDHNVPTTDRSHGIADPVSKLQVDTLDSNCDAFGITQFKMNDLRQGIVHIIGPE